MSRIGKSPITVPSGVEVTIADQHVVVKGPRGSLDLDVVDDITVRQEGDLLHVERPDDERRNRAMHGLTRSLVNNMVVGVSEGFKKELQIIGVGYRALAKGDSALELQLGYSHSINVKAPDGITFWIVDGTVERVDIDTDEIDTKSGGRIGRTEEWIRETWPDRIQASPLSDGTGNLLAFVPRDEPDQEFRVMFQTDGQEVVRMWSGRLPWVEELGGCPAG